MSRCRSCGAEIIWILTAAGKKMPCNPEPVTFTRAGGPDTFVLASGKVERGRRGSGPQTGFISHFATCPEAALHRHAKRPDLTVEAREDARPINYTTKDPDRPQ